MTGVVNFQSDQTFDKGFLATTYSTVAAIIPPIIEVGNTASNLTPSPIESSWIIEGRRRSARASDQHADAFLAKIFVVEGNL
jgi:hypothetical protein